MPIIYRSTNFDYIDWQVPIEHFLWDRLDEAHEGASGITVGALGEYLPWYRMIEAEWLTRSRGQIEQVNTWLKVETISHETDGAGDLGQRIAEICVDTARDFRVDERPEIMVSVLSADSDAPWVDARAGYFIDKFPYDKICIPQRAAFNPAHLKEVVSHEYSHALNLALTQAKCPLWLNEGIAMLAELELDPHIQEDLATGKAPWRAPHQLDAAFHAEAKGERNATTIHRAYEQSAWIVRYLLTLHDRPKLGELMRGFSDNSFLVDLKIRLTAEDPAEEALRQVYGLGEAQLFADAHEWLQSQPVGHREGG